MMSPLLKGKSRTLQIYCIYFRLLKSFLLNPPRISYVNAGGAFPAWIIQSYKTKRHAIAWRFFGVFRPTNASSYRRSRR
ncbi:hypothetical protein DR72_4731 [Klebsiella aerogenes]|nr:hypothetical protein DR72_4731 [Klebsiella aerogenes]